MNYQSLWEQVSPKVLVDDGCWHWTGARQSDGYGSFQRSGQTRLAHRAMYELFVGDIPEGLELDHLCRDRGCVRPDHLEPVAHLENVRRGALRLVRRTEKRHRDSLGRYV